MWPELSIVVGSYNRRPFLQLAISSALQEVEGLAHEIIVVDGGSTDGSLEWLTRQKNIITVVQHNRGVWRGQPVQRRSWGYFMNLAFKTAQGKYVCMLSDDCLVIPGAIKNGYRLFEEKLQAGEKVGAVAFYFRDWPVQDKYYLCCTPEGYLYVNHGLYLNRALREVGYADEETYQFYAADIDLGLKMRAAGYQIIASPDSFIEHYIHSNVDARSANSPYRLADSQRLTAKWESIMLDPETGYVRPSRMIEKEYQDPSSTARRFAMLHLTNVGFFAWKVYEPLRTLISTLRSRTVHASLPQPESFHPEAPAVVLRVLQESRIYRIIRKLGRWRSLDARITETFMLPPEQCQQRALALLLEVKRARLYRIVRGLGRWGPLDAHINAYLASKSELQSTSMRTH